MLSKWLGLGTMRFLFQRRLNNRCRVLRQRHRHRAKCRIQQRVETLEQRRVLAFDFVSAYVTDDAPFYVTNATDNAELVEAPQQIALRFTPGVEIDASSLGGISVVRSGGPDDPFGSFGSFVDQAVAPGAILVDDFPSQNQVVIRFAETLPDDTYRIIISGSDVIDPVSQQVATAGLKSSSGELFRDGDTFSFDVRLSLGQQIVAVVPQPISRDVNDVTAELTQNRDVIEVFYDQAEPLDRASAETPHFYKLITIDEATGTDVVGGMASPTSVAYDSASHKATLTFSPGAIADDSLYRLEIGGPGILPDPTVKAEQEAPHDSLGTAQPLGLIDQAGVLLSGRISPQTSLEMPGDIPTLFYPTQAGTLDEPGHRNVPIDDSNHGLPETAPATPPEAGDLHTIKFNFRSDYGRDAQGNQLQNVITSEQRLRVREIFDLFSRYAGLRFVETADQGITVATGDTRVISDNTATSVLQGLARGSLENGLVSPDALAIVNSTVDWGESEYGGAYFREAIRQIGQVLGLWNSFDLPSLMAGDTSQSTSNLPGENVFPSDYDILHLQQLYPRSGTEIDVYSFTLDADGELGVETFAARLPAEASTLDTVVSVYDSNGTLVGRNDDSFGRDSRISLSLTAGNYFIAVSSVGNTVFDLNVTNSGLGGLTQGAYELRLSHTPFATATSTIIDSSKTPLDGDRDGKAGGSFNFHFRTATPASTIYVDKIATDAITETRGEIIGAEQIVLEDTTGIRPGMLVLGQGIPEGITVETTDSTTHVTLSSAVTLSAGTTLRFVTPGDGSLANPFFSIGDALGAVTGTTKIIRILGNEGNELEGWSPATNRGSIRPNAKINNAIPYHYYLGYDDQGKAWADGLHLTVPAGVALIIDAGATLRLAQANVDVGSSSELVSRRGASLQVLGTPGRPVTFSSTKNAAGITAGTQVGQTELPQGGDWGGIVLRSDSDWQPSGSLAYETLRPILNNISNAVISHAGGQVLVDAELQSFAAIQLEDTRPTIAFNEVNFCAGPAISATPNSFAESHGRTGPEFRGNTLRYNSTNGVFLAIRTEFGKPLDKLDVSARFASTEVSYVLQESLVIAGGAGGYQQRDILANVVENWNGELLTLRPGETQSLKVGMSVAGPGIAPGTRITAIGHLGLDNIVISDPGATIASGQQIIFGEVIARPSGRLQIDPGVVVKLQNSRIELERGTSQLLAEGVDNDRVIFTSLGDNRYGAGGTFDTNGNLPNKFDEFGAPITPETVGDWGGIVLNAGASASIDNAYLAFGGGEVPLEGGLDDFNVIEVHQADLRLANSRIEVNASGLAESDRNHRGTNEAATIFVRGAQPVIVGNDFRNNAGTLISVNANALSDTSQGDRGRQTGFIDRYDQYDDNRGPLLKGNRISNTSTAGNSIAGLGVRAEEITVESVWDDTEIVHVVTNEIIVNNFHTATGLRLESDTTASLVVKFAGLNAGLTASGEVLDIDDRIGGTVQIVGQPGFPVILTSLSDDSVGASVDLLGFPVTDTNSDGEASQPAPGDWRGLRFLPLANDRNVAVANETEPSYTTGQDGNATVSSAEYLGVLAPNAPTGTNTWASAQEKTGDENRRYGFEVHGAIAYDDSGDVDTYTFDGYAGSEVWIDIDKTSTSLDTMVELLDASGRVLARSADSQVDMGTTIAQTVTGNGIAEVNGFETLVKGTAAATNGVGGRVAGSEVQVTGVATRATGYSTKVLGIGARVDVPASAGSGTLVLDNSAGIRIKSIVSGAGLAPNTLVESVNGNTLILSKPLLDDISAGEWITSDIAGLGQINTARPVFAIPPVGGVWVSEQTSANRVSGVGGDAGEVSLLVQSLAVTPNTIDRTLQQRFAGGGRPYAEYGDPIVDTESGVLTEDNSAFYRLIGRDTDGTGDSQTVSPAEERGITWGNIAPTRWQEVRTSIDVRSIPKANNGIAEEGFVFVFQNDGVNVPLPRAAMDSQATDTSVNQVIIHLDPFGSGSPDPADKHISLLWGTTRRERVLPFEIDDNTWRTVEFLLTPETNGARMRVFMTDGDRVELLNVFLDGYSVIAPTQFAVGAAGDSTFSATQTTNNRIGKLDVDNFVVNSKESDGTTNVVTLLGLDPTTPTVAKDLQIDNAAAVRAGQTVSTTTALSRNLTSGNTDAFAEPNDIRETAIQAPISIDDTGATSSFEIEGWIGDNQYGGKDVDLFYLAVPKAARGSTLTLEVDTSLYSDLTRLDDSYLRLFDADGNQLAANDNGASLDSFLSFNVPGDDDGRGYYVGVSGTANRTYSVLLANSGTSSASGQYLLRGSFSHPFNVPAASLAGQVELSAPIGVTEGQLLPVSLGSGPVTTSYIAVNDSSSIVLGSQLSGIAGVSAGTRVVGIDPATNVLQLSQPATIRLSDLAKIGFNSTAVSLIDTSSLTAGMAVSGLGVPADTTVVSATPTTALLSQRVNVADSQFLQFGFLGSAITTNVLFLDDTAASVGAEVSLATDPDNPLATVSAIDASSGAVTLSIPITVSEGDLLNFGFAGAPVSARRVIVDDTSGVVEMVLVNTVGAGLLDQRVPNNTAVINAAVGGGILELSNAVRVAADESLGFGFNGLEVKVDDVRGAAIGSAVSGRGIAPGTTVADILPAPDPDSPAGTIVFSQSVNVEDAVRLTFSEQILNVLEAPDGRGVVVLPGSASGTVSVGSTAIQTFTATRDGTLNLTPISNPAARVTSGQIDYQTGEITLSFDTAPVAPVSIEVDYEFGNLGLETLGFSRVGENEPWLNGAFPLTKDAYRGNDFYTTNPRDAGMRVVLPGTVGTQQKFFVRVRSQPTAGTDQPTHEESLRDAGLLGTGQTRGAYEFRLRTRQRDDKPGSTVRFADIRYPDIGIDVVGLPNNSPLVGTTGETIVDANNTFATAQQVGNLLTSDRNTISIAGDIAAEGDIDWYRFSLSYEDIQSVLGHNDGQKTWSTVFDIDYADGFRGDLTLSVFDESGRLIYVGRDSNVADDQPGPGQGNDFDDLSRGSVGALDPFIGSAQLDAGSTDPMTYYVAVSSNERIPAALDGSFEANATTPLARLEPVNSVRRIVEDHIGSTGYTSLDGTEIQAAGIINTSSALELSANVRPFTLSDVTLYVSTSSVLYTYNPYSAAYIATINDTSYSNGAVGDIDMRTDGRLFQYASIGSGGANDGFGDPNNPADGAGENEGKLRRLDTGTGAILYEQRDGITGYQAGQTMNGSLIRPHANNSNAVDALAIRRTGTTFYSIRDSLGTNNSRLYQVDSVGAYATRFSGSTHNTNVRSNSRYAGVIQGDGIVGVTTGMQHLGDSGQLYGVNAAGQFYTISESTAAATLRADFSELLDVDFNGFNSETEGFQGLAAAPVNLYGGRFQGMFFAITGAGRLVVIDPDGAADGSAALLDNVFDSNDDGIADRYYSAPTAFGATGLAFSPLDVNLWHPTSARSTDAGHGVNPAVDTTRFSESGGRSMYFGLDGSAQSYGQGGQYGVYSDTWQADLLANPEIAQTYNTPGGAHGSLITNSFSLAGYSYTDKPTLYFNYFLETENAGNSDAARVFASTDSGQTWSLIATNNHISGELPPAQSASSRIGEAENQIVQELYDNTGTWRQARVDLGEYAGNANIQLRFDFTTAGVFRAGDTSQGLSDLRRTVVTGGGAIGDGSVISSTPFVPLDSVAGLEVGMTVRRLTTEPIATIVDQIAVLDARILAIDTENNSVTLDSPVAELQDGEGLMFFKQAPSKNEILGPAGTAGSWGGSRRAQNNQHEGFYIDDIIVGFTERGEMVTAAATGQTTFYDIRTPLITDVTGTLYPQQTLTGEYQLEIRRGTEYATTLLQTSNSESYRSSSMGIHTVYDTNDRFVLGSGRTERILRENSLEVIDGADLRTFGNGLVEPLLRVLAEPAETSQAIRLSSDPSSVQGTSSNSMLAWYVDLANQPAAVLNYAVELSSTEQVVPLPPAFVFNAWKTAAESGDDKTPQIEVVGLPIGDGVAVSTDGGVNWKTIDNFAWSGRRSVDLIAAFGPLNETTVIGFFREGRANVFGDGFIDVRELSITTAPAEVRTGTLGDSNNVHELEQGQFLIASNFITDAAAFGVRVVGDRDTNNDPYLNYAGSTNAPHLGVVRNTPVLNNASLVPGVVINNNVIARSGEAGVLYRGEASSPGLPASAVPYGRIFNNTIVGGGVGVSDTVSLPATQLSGTYSEGGSVLRTRLDAVFSEIHSITLIDDGSRGGLGGAVSGVEIDAIAISESYLTAAGAVTSMPSLDVFSFSTPGTSYAPGTQFGEISKTGLHGTVENAIDFDAATLGSFDRTGNPLTGVVSLGADGEITFTLHQPLQVNGPLYIYVGEAVDANEGLLDNSIVVHGRLQDRGIDVQGEAGPTILNNVFADLGYGVLVDDSSRFDSAGNHRTVVNTSAFYNVNTPVLGTTQTQAIDLGANPFINAGEDNYYPTAQSPIVDSSLNSLQDRNAYTVVTEPLGIAASPIVTPAFDLYGQLRADDPDQASAPGLGLNVFKDRGAIERVDRSAPRARLTSPLDQTLEYPLIDKNDELDAVRLEGREARAMNRFVLQLDDIGVGVDRASVTADAVSLFRDETALHEGIDYYFQYNANTNQIILASPVVFELGDYRIELQPDPTEGHLVDRAGNPLAPNAISDGVPYSSFVVSLADVPAAPTQMSALSGDGEASISWTSPYTAPSMPLIRFDLEYSVDDGKHWTAWTPADGGIVTQSPVTVDWPNNQTRLYRIRGINEVGDGLGAWSRPFGAKASPPLNAEGAPGLNGISLSWEAPKNNGGAFIQAYIIDRSDDGGATWVRVNQTPTTPAVFISGLPPNVDQVFRVAATTANGVGAWSAPTIPKAAEGLPDAPSTLATEFDSQDGSLLLSWEAPASSGGREIESYTLWFSDGINVGEQPAIPGTSFDMDNVFLPWIRRGTEYTFKVKAVNFHGGGEWSPAVVQQTADIPQTAPLINAVTAGNASVELQWTAVADDLLPVTDYVIQQSLDEGLSWTTINDGVGTETTHEITGLSRGNGRHLFRVAAKNPLPGVPDSDWVYSAATMPVLPLAPAAAIQNLQAVAGNGGVTLSWSAPADDGGAAITDYQVEYNDGLGWQIFADGISATTEANVTGLTNGLNYSFRVAAMTLVGPGNVAELGPVMPFGSPTAVTGLQATAGVEQVALTWIAPASDGGQAIGVYTIEYALSETGPWAVFTGDSNTTDLTALVGPLQKQTTYFFKVTAINAAGSGPASTVVSATPTGTLDAPSGLVFTPDPTDGSLQLNWTAPANPNALAVTYEVRFRPVGGSWIPFVESNASDTAVDIAGLPRGVNHEFQVRAVNGVGSGPWLTGSWVTPDVPTAPTGLTAIPASGQIGVIQLSWVAPVVDANELAVTDYVVQQSLDGGVNWSTIADDQNTRLSYEATALSRDAGDHLFRVAAKNVLPGISDDELLFSQPSSPVRPLGLSEGVRNLVASPGDRAVTLRWSVPLDTGGVPVSDYVVERNDGFGWQLVSDGVSPTTEATVDSLINGAAYDLRVTPQTPLGSGESATVFSVVPYGVPASPSDLVVVDGIGNITANWTAPSSNGRAIADYRVQYGESLSGPWTTLSDAISATPTATLTGVPAGVNLYVRVAAINEAGVGAYTAAVGPAIAKAVPEAPSSVAATIGADGSIGLNWSAPVRNGGSPITDYVVQYRPTASSVWTTYTEGVSTGRSATLTGLSRISGPYVFRVLAKNAVGVGPASATSNEATPLTAPGPVQNLVAAVGDGQLHVSWQVPEDNGGTAVNDFIVEYKTSSASTWSGHNDGEGTSTSTTIAELINGVNYRVRVRAKNSVGEGPAIISSLIMPVTAPGTPTPLIVSADSGRATLTWTKPSGGGLPITDYVVQYRLASASSWTTAADGVTATSSATLTGLTNGATYVFRVAAVTTYAMGDFATSATQVIGPKAAAPSVAFAERSGGGLLLSWNRITPPSGFSVLGYQVEYYDSTDGAWVTAGTAAASSNSFAVSGSGLVLSRTYTLRVAAITSVGVGNFKISNGVVY